MKKNNIHHKIGIVLFSLSLVFLVSFFIFNLQQSKFTGYVTENDSSKIGFNETANSTEIVNRSDALFALNESEEIIKEMEENNFSILYMNDTLLRARIVFEQAEYVQILNNPSSSNEEKQIARNALRLVDWKNISYADVLVYTDEIKMRREKAFLLFDQLTIEEARFLEQQEKLSNSTKISFNAAKTAFYEDRYEESEFLIDEFRAGFEKDISELSFLSAVKKGSKNFVQRYWIQIIIFLVLVSVAGYFYYKKREKKRLEMKIKKMMIETKVLNDLIKKTQIERFKQNKISGLIYNIRIKKYQTKIEQIKQDLPIFEKRLEQLKKKK